MKLCLQIGPEPRPTAVVEALVQTAEAAGYHALLAAESHGWDTFTPLGWWGSTTEALRLTSLAEIGARAPTSTAMQALSLDHLSGGRAVLALTSNTELAEGWFGSRTDDLAGRLREYVDVVRQVLRREGTVSNDGPHYPLPYVGEDSVGLGTPRKSIVHPYRADLPIWLAASHLDEAELAGEIAEGVVVRGCRAETAEVWAEAFSAGAARRSRGLPVAQFGVAAFCDVLVSGDGSLAPSRRSGGRPRIAGPPRSVRQQVRAWERAGITCLVVRPSNATEACAIADTVLGC